MNVDVEISLAHPNVPIWANASTHLANGDLDDDSSANGGEPETRSFSNDSSLRYGTVHGSYNIRQAPAPRKGALH